jgi:hypothetical protein
MEIYYSVTKPSQRLHHHLLVTQIVTSSVESYRIYCQHTVGTKTVIREISTKNNFSSAKLLT